MINDLTVSIKDYSEKIINSNLIICYVCPKCGAKHSLIKHGYYDRNVCFFDDKFNLEESRLTILRMLCKSCDSTHAILPYDIIPYKIYDRSIFYCILTDHFVCKETIESISEKYNISTRVICEFIKIFRIFLNSLCLFLKVLIGFSGDISTIAEIIILITKHPKYYLYQYYNHTKWIFLMNKFKNSLSKSIYVGVHFEPPT